ncbi:MAG: ABC transporter ATP-binding protein [Puniceicoccaceae bacterium]
MEYKRYIKLAKRQKKLLAVGIAAGAVAGAASGFGAPFFLEKVFKRIFEDTTTTYSLTYVALIAALLPGVFLIRGISSYINQYFLQWTIQNILLDLRQQLFNKLQVLPVVFFEKRKSGDLMAKLVADTLAVQESILIVARDAFIQPFTFLAGISYLVYLSWKQSEVGFLLLILIIAPLMIVPIGLIGKQLRKRSRNLQHTLGEITDVMAENLRGVVEVRSFNLQEKEKSRFLARLRDYNKYAMKMAKYYHMSQPFMELLAVTVVSAAFVYAYQKGITFSTFMAMGMALYFSADALKRLVRMFNGIQKATGSFDRIESVLNEEETVQDIENPVVLPAPQGNLKVEGLKFSYTDNLEEPDLDIPELEIPHGTICALVGPSGAGKTTFAKLVQRFYDPNAGKVAFDGVDIRTLRKSHLREQIAFVPQAPVLFNGTIRDNLMLARPQASEAEMIEAARQAHAEEFILSLPDGYDSLVGENAVRLSGGQRQRLALARAFLKNAPILVLDEATSALDSESEEKIQQALQTIARGRTLLIIAHRFATIRMANHILLFEKGVIRSKGDFPTMMEDALFKRLYEVQAGNVQSNE